MTSGYVGRKIRNRIVLDCRCDFLTNHRDIAGLPGQGHKGLLHPGFTEIYIYIYIFTGLREVQEFLQGHWFGTSGVLMNPYE